MSVKPLRLKATVISALMAIALLAAACAGDDSETIVEKAAEENTPAVVLGERFEGTATVDEVLSNHAFRLLDTLVVSAEPVDVAEGERVVVRGTVRRWDVQAIEEDLAVNFDEPLDLLDDEFVVVAQHLEEAPEDDTR